MTKLNQLSRSSRDLLARAHDFLALIHALQRKYPGIGVPEQLRSELRTISAELKNQIGSEAIVAFARALEDVLDCSVPGVLASIPKPVRSRVRAVYERNELNQRLGEREKRNVDFDDAMRHWPKK